MLLRLVRGLVDPGEEDRFVEVVRETVRAKTPSNEGLVALACRYRRVAGRDEFLIASAWRSVEDLRQLVGGDLDAEGAVSAWSMDGVARVDGVHHYELLEPVDPGILDAPAAVVRLIEASLRVGRENDFYAFMRERHDQLLQTQLLLGFQAGRRVIQDREQVVAVSSWAGPDMLREVVEPGRRSMAMFAVLDEYLEDVRVEEFTALELRLPETLRTRGGRRVLAAEFASRDGAASARDVLERSFPEARAAGVSLAPLGSTDYTVGAANLLLVARLALADAFRAERLIADLGGRLLYASDEGDSPPSARSST